MFKLYLGSAFDGRVFTQERGAFEQYLGPLGLLHWLEGQLGIAGLPDNTDYLRIELYRQAMQQLIDEMPGSEPFYTASFAVDRYGAAQYLLEWRDELLVGGWDFSIEESMPERLRVFAELEIRFRKKINSDHHAFLAQGFADRYSRALSRLDGIKTAVDEIRIYDQKGSISPSLLRFIKWAEQAGIPVEYQTFEPVENPDTDLDCFKNWCLGGGETGALKGDGSILLVQCRRDSDAAGFVADLSRCQSEWSPVVILPELDRLLDEALIHYRQPSMGVLSSSQARPSLQVLKLAPAFLWEPLDVYKLMEFVTLPIKPIADELARKVARALAEKPGLFNDVWQASVKGFLESDQGTTELKDQYQYWFERKRFDREKLAPKRDFIDLFDYVHQWAIDAYREGKGAIQSLLVLAEQARKLREILITLPEEQIGYLELERIIRTVYAPSPLHMSIEASESWDHVHEPGAFADPAESVLWWNFIHEPANLPADRWRAEELEFLSAFGAIIENNRDRSARLIFQRMMPVLNTGNRLVCIVPEYVSGDEAVSHWLSGDLEACFDSLEAIRFDLDSESDRNSLGAYLKTGERIGVQTRATKERPLFLNIRANLPITSNEYESPTSLESLFYYPHRWFMRQKLKITPVHLYAVAPDYRLLGNLAHRFFEFLFREDCLNWDRKKLSSFQAALLPDLLRREGSTLLLYGREPERDMFVKKLENAAWALITQLRQNSWEVIGTEQKLEGTISGVPVVGKADLLLRRNDELGIIDLKWSGASRRKDLIRSREDLQLVLYAHLLRKENVWPHTAYFILENGQLIARNTEGFAEATVPGSPADHRTINDQILEQMEKTLVWRLEQLSRGEVEMRTESTAVYLDDHYGALSLDMLEMKQESARFDDYRILLEFG